MTNVAIIGQGNVGFALEEGLEPSEHDVKTVGHQADEVHDTADWGEIVVLAVPFDERENAVEEMGNTIEGKTLVDVTNAITDDNEYASSTEKSGAEELQEMASEANVVKAFNTVFAEQMSQGNSHGEPLTVFVAGDNDTARQHTSSLAEDIGFETADTGPLENARWLEGMGYLHVKLAYEQGMGDEIGFHLVNPRGS
ncbi:hypothetical protein BRD56_02200 [Thermoplasmatales archaeon SW_10_69_26]|nr:MAG: hypothetical protein BRD56_02200 [Thermoplasmatales archaeon SW_10_69_26]